MPVALREYREKRQFSQTPEPSGATISSKAQKAKLAFVVHKHRATSLHYDFRLEWHGVLLSWAIPKGPSLDPSVKRLAMPVEDHPLEYGDFEGVIPEGEYGGGTVMVWDRGTWTPDAADVDAGLQKGDLKFTLQGKKLKGSWVLVRTKGGFPPSSGRPAWLLIKHRDEFASKEDVTVTEPRSVKSGRTMEEIARAGGGDVAKAASADPVPKSAVARAAGSRGPRQSRPASRSRRSGVPGRVSTRRAAAPTGIAKASRHREGHRARGT
jgi:bifunctional non-homologous end joining protein LigD